MKKNLKGFTYIILCLCMMAVMLIRPLAIEAKVSDMERITDYADILTENEEGLLRAQLTTISQKYDIDVIVMTISDAGNYDLDYYVDQLYRGNSYAENGVILAINMDPYEREVLVQGQADCQKYITNKRAQNITDSMVPDMKAGNYYKGILTYIEKVDYFASHKKPIATPLQILLEALGAILVAGIVVFIMVKNAGGKDTTTSDTYLNTSSSKILAKQDIYTHTTTTRHKIQSNNGGSGGHGGGGGHSTGRSSF